MADKSLAILHERLQQGSISLDEFNRKSEELGKKDKLINFIIS